MLTTSSTLKRDVTKRLSHQLLSLYFPRPMADQVLLRPQERLRLKTFFF
jgi:hypothetical protein